jgi:ubiquinone/menaquinone biosynthesis C-methylase UbiE
MPEQDRKSSENMALLQKKYEPGAGLLTRFAMTRFYHTLEKLLSQVEADAVLDAGCGEGYILTNILKSRFETIIGVDLDNERLNYATQIDPTLSIFEGNVQHLPLPDNAVDLALSLEVLEHVGQPEIVLNELHRVTRKYVILSVPNEPFWRMGNIARGAYWRDWGNTPEHINHWSIWGFKRFVGERFNIIASATPVTWSFVLAEKR